MPNSPNDFFRTAQRLQSHPSRWKRILASIAGAFVLGISFFLGIFALLIVAGLMVLVGLFVGIRVWWLQRRHRGLFGRNAEHNRTHNTATGAERKSGNGRIIEGESEDITKRENQE